jgi:mono/diheme cytochrome c family protein
MLSRLTLALTGALMSAVPFAASAQDAARGKELYETRCVGCHSRSVHNRASRKAGSFEAVRTEVSRWNKELGGTWRAEEIDDVSVYLNDRYYKFPCPQSVCKVDKRAADRAARG